MWVSRIAPIVKTYSKTKGNTVLATGDTLMNKTHKKKAFMEFSQSQTNMEDYYRCW